MSQKAETEIMASVSSVLGFIKQNVKNKLVEANNANQISVNQNELKRLTSLVEAFIDEGYFKASSEITNAIKSSVNNSSSKTKRK